MLKNITLSADENLIQSARKKAQSKHSTLNAEFRQWLQQYTNSDMQVKDYNALMNSLDYAEVAKKFSRDEMNER